VLGAAVFGAVLAAYGTGEALIGQLLGWVGPAPGSRDAPAGGRIPPDRPARIAILGTSLTARGTWPDDLALRLSACRPSGVEVRRTARPGASSRWGAEAIGRALAPEGGPPPDILVIEFATNDAALHRGVRLRRSVALHREMLARAGEVSGEAPGQVSVFLATMNPGHGAAGWARPGLAAYNAAYRRLAAEGLAGLIDTGPAWGALGKAERRRLIPDGLHPGEEGMRRVAVPAFAAALAPLVCTRPPDTGSPPQESG
jgi:lysophospholipase L1-like esterase